MIVLETIVSGGQTGADFGALKAGKRLGLETGGWAPKGWMTQDGPAPWLVDYGLEEHPQEGYPPRTFSNVKDSDGTVRFAKNFLSPGEMCTLKAIKRYEKPYFDFHWWNFQRGNWGFHFHAKTDFLAWLDENQIKTLNVAGNSEKTAKGIGKAVEEFLVDALAEIQFERFHREYKLNKEKISDLDLELLRNKMLACWHETNKNGSFYDMMKVMDD